MGKPKHERDLADNQAMAMARLLRTSPRKLNLVAQLIQGRKAADALNQLTFSRRGIARDVSARDKRAREIVDGGAGRDRIRIDLRDRPVHIEIRLR